MQRHSSTKTIYQAQRHVKHKISPQDSGNYLYDSDPSSTASPAPFRYPYSPTKGSRRDGARLSSEDDLLFDSSQNIPCLSETDNSDDSWDIKVPARRELSSRLASHKQLSFKINSELSFKYKRELSFSSTNNTDETPSVEVSPGVYVPLRGAAETMEAIPNDFYTPTSCACCDSTIFCIQDANYILCPICRVVSPLEGLHEGLRNGCVGAGLGFTMEELGEWQNDLYSGGSST